MNPEALSTSSVHESKGEQKEVLEPAQDLREAWREVNALLQTGPEEKAETSDSFSQRLQVGPEEIVAAKAAVGFTERQTALQEAHRTAFERFQEKVERALLPLTTALAMNLGPALAAESPQAPASRGVEAVVAQKNEARELKPEDVFNLASPLAIRGEMMKKLKREMSSDELALALDFQRKAWKERNEWGVISGKDKTGAFIAKTSEGEANTVRMPWDIIRSIKSNLSLTHTHPVEVDLNSGAKQLMREGKLNSFVAPPSASDLILSCQSRVMDPKAMNQVVDPRGIWEYVCDEKMMEAFTGPQKQLKAGIDNASLLHGMLPEDRARLEMAFSKLSRSPYEYSDEYFEKFALQNFEKFISESFSYGYPGLEQTVASLLEAYKKQKQALVEDLLDNEEWSMWIRRNAASYSDEELAVRIRNLIENAERKGIAMAYTPFKELPQDKVLKQR